MKKLMCDTLLVFAVLGMLAAVGALIEQTMPTLGAVLLLAACALGAYLLNRISLAAPQAQPKPVRRSSVPKLRVKPTPKAKKRLVVA